LFAFPCKIYSTLHPTTADDGPQHGTDQKGAHRHIGHYLKFQGILEVGSH